MKSLDPSLTDVVRVGLEAFCKDFTLSVAPSGFTRSKKMLWTRRHDHAVDFIHLHRFGSSYGGPINASIALRTNVGLRVLNDTFPALALLGPCSDQLRPPSGANYHLRFNAVSGSTRERCAADLMRFLDDHGLPWLRRFDAPESLLDDPASPLDANGKALLAQALAGQAAPANIEASLKLLGLARR